MRALRCAQLLRTILHRTNLIIFPFTFQTIIIAPMMSIWGKEALLFMNNKQSICDHVWSLMVSTFYWSWPWEWDSQKEWESHGNVARIKEIVGIWMGIMGNTLNGNDPYSRGNQLPLTTLPLWNQGSVFGWLIHLHCRQRAWEVKNQSRPSTVVCKNQLLTLTWFWEHLVGWLVRI